MSLWVDAINHGLIVAVFAVALNVLLGHTGLLSVATVGLGGVGGYAAGWLSADHGWPAWAALAAAALAGLLAGVVLGVPALRLGPDYLIVLTLAFATIVGALAAAIPDLGGRQGMLGVQTVDLGGRLVTPQELLRFTVPLTAAASLVCWRLVSSPFGRVLRAIREDDVAVDALGKRVVAAKTTTFALTSLVAGVGGAMLVFYQQLASPAQFSFATTTAVVAAVVIGGTGNLAGSVVGAVGLALLQPTLQRLLDLDPVRAALWQQVAFGALLVAVLVWRPAGLIPERVHSRRGAGTGGRVARQSAGAGRMPDARADDMVVGSGARAALRLTEPTVLPVAGSDAQAPAVDGGIVLEATGLAKRFGAIAAVNGLDLRLPAGKITALVGPNGAGKTTVFNLLTGREPLDAGTVTLRGVDVTDWLTHRRVTAGMVRTFQDVRSFARLSVLDNVRVAVPGQPGERALDLYRRPRAVAAGERTTTDTACAWLDFVGLLAQADRPAGDLAFGDQKLLAIARGLATGSDVLLLDEPASGIDRASLEPILVLIERLRAAGRTICLVEHNLDVVARLADSVLFMERGRVSATGTMAELTSDARLTAAYFGHG